MEWFNWLRKAQIDKICNILTKTIYRTTFSLNISLEVQLRRINDRTYENWRISRNLDF